MSQHLEFTDCQSVDEDIQLLQQEVAALCDRLNSQESHWHRRIEAMPQIVWVADLTGAVTYISPQWETWTGLPVVESLGFDFLRGIRPSDRDRTLRQWRQAVNSDQPFEIQLHLRRTDGSYHLFWVRGRPVIDESGQVLEWVGTYTNINKLSQTEAELQERDRRFRAIFDQTFQFIGLMAPDGRLIEVNQTALQFAGLAASEVIGRPFWQTRWWSLSPESQEQLRQAIATAATGKFIRYEVKVLGVGETVATLDFSIKPVFDHDGRVILLIPEGRDITERKKIEADFHTLNADLEQRVAERTAQLEASNQHKGELLRRERDAKAQLEAATATLQIYADTVKHMQVGLSVWRLENTTDPTSLQLLATNPAASQLLGISLATYVGKRMVDCFPKLATTYRTDLELYAQVALSGKGIEQYEMHYSDERVQDRFFSIKAFALPNRCVGIAFDDVTQRKLAGLTLQERTKELMQLNATLAHTTSLLQHRNKELDEFAYVASHDLKAPLRAIANLSEWIEEDLSSQLPEENCHQLKLLRQRVFRMETLINGLLAYSRIGRTQTSLETIQVSHLLADVIDSLSPPPSLTIEIAPDMPTLTTKALLLSQVFSNLISNAIKHRDRLNGHILISVADQGESYEFAVTDDGPGIAAENYSKIFVIFQTLKPSENTDNTGIGLTIVKKIVEVEGGTIRVESCIGKGSTFRFTWRKRPKSY